MGKWKNVNAFTAHYLRLGAPGKVATSVQQYLREHPGGCHKRHPKCTKTHPSEMRSRPGRALPGPSRNEEVLTGKAKHKEWVCPPSRPESSSSREQQPATTTQTARQLPSDKSNARPLPKQTKTSTGDQEHDTPIPCASPSRSLPPRSHLVPGVRISLRCMARTACTKYERLMQ